HRRSRCVRDRARARRRRRPRTGAPGALARIGVSRAHDTARSPRPGRTHRRSRRSGGRVVTFGGCTAVAGGEGSKLAAQARSRVVLAACGAGPVAFAAAMRVQTSVPEDTLFGRSVQDSGFAVPLVVLGFAALWVLPVLASVAGGDVFSAEDRYGTWKTVLTRS